MHVFECQWLHHRTLGGIGIAVAAHFRGPYRRLSTSKAFFAAEDGYMWATPRGYHMLTHAFVGAGSDHPDDNGVGGHAWSVDARTWRYASAAYTTDVRWSNATVSALYRRERPQPLVAGGRAHTRAV